MPQVRDLEFGEYPGFWEWVWSRVKTGAVSVWSACKDTTSGFRKNMGVIVMIIGAIWAVRDMIVAKTGILLVDLWQGCAIIGIGIIIQSLSNLRRTYNAHIEEIAKGSRASRVDLTARRQVHQTYTTLRRMGHNPMDIKRNYVNVKRWHIIDALYDREQAKAVARAETEERTK